MSNQVWKTDVQKGDTVLDFNFGKVTITEMSDRAGWFWMRRIKKDGSLGPEFLDIGNFLNCPA